MAAGLECDIEYPASRLTPRLRESMNFSMRSLRAEMAAAPYNFSFLHDHATDPRVWIGQDSLRAGQIQCFLHERFVGALREVPHGGLLDFAQEMSELVFLYF